MIFDKNLQVRFYLTILNKVQNETTVHAVVHTLRHNNC